MARILVVDDDPWIVRMVKSTLEKRGFVVDTAREGRQALERAQAHPPDVIISDVMMPVMDGWSFVEQLRSVEALAQIPVILLTALGKDEARLRKLGMGDEHYLAKPFRFDDLEQRVVAALSKAGQAQPESQPTEHSGPYPYPNPPPPGYGVAGYPPPPGYPATPYAGGYPPPGYPTGYPGGFPTGYAQREYYPNPYAPAAPDGQAPGQHPTAQPQPPAQSPPDLQPPGQAPAQRPPGPSEPRAQPQSRASRGPNTDELEPPPGDTGTRPRRPTALNGRLEQLQLSSLLVMMEMERKHGLLTLNNASSKEKGKIYLRGGQVVSSKIEGKPDVAARECVYDMLGWKSGTFSFNATEVDVEDEVKSSTTHLLMEGARRIDESNRSDDDFL